MKREDKIIAKNPVNTAKRLYSFIKPYRAVYFTGWFFLVLSSLSALTFPMLMGQLLGADKDEAALISLGDLDFNDINIVLLALLIVFASQSLFSFLRIVLFNQVTEKVLRDIKIQAFQKLTALPIDFYNRNKVGELTSRIATDVQLLQETFNTTLAEFFRQLLTIGVAIVFIFSLSWELALWMIAVVPVLAIAALLFGRYIRSLSKNAQNESAKSNAVLEETLTGIFNVKAFTNEKYEVSRFLEKINHVMKLNIKSGIMRGLFVSFIIFCLFGGVAFVIWKAKGMQHDGLITFAAFNAFILFTIFLGTSFASIPDLYAKIQKTLGSSEKLIELLEEKNEISGSERLKNFGGDVYFKNVSFAYAQRKEIEVLRGANFHCKSGQITALVGGSGSGKTTIASLLLKMYQPDSGSILFDETDISTIENFDIRSRIAVVPQEVLLFSGSIRENILYGNIHATDDELRDAAQKANALEFIESFPDKFETLVGDRGIQLSGGQRQRIAIARAVLKKPQLLILDEATSALDSASEKLVQDALDRIMKTCTSIVIAHRLTTIKHADKILVLEQGKIVEEGSHNELIAKNGAYTRLQNLHKNIPDQLS